MFLARCTADLCCLLYRLTCLRIFFFENQFIQQLLQPAAEYLLPILSSFRALSLGAPSTVQLLAFLFLGLAKEIRVGGMGGLNRSIRALVAVSDCFRLGRPAL